MLVGFCFVACSEQWRLFCGVFEMCCLFQFPYSCFEAIVNIKPDMCVSCETFSSRCVVCSKSRPLATTSKLGQAEIPEVFLCRNAEFASSADDDD